MKRRLLPFLSVLLVLAMVFSAAACSTTSSSEQNAVSAEGDEFRYTLETGALTYEADDLEPGEPFDVTLSIEYIGDQESIDVWCTDDLGTISMEDENGQTLLDDDLHTRATSRVTLKKGTPYTIQWTGADEYKEYGGIPAGEYSVVAYINFSTDAAYESIQENTLDLDLIVK